MNEDSKNYRIAVILSGAGVYDGAEIQESVLSLLHLTQQGFKIQAFAPNIEQHHVIDHTTGQEMPESRNVLVEAARITRGNIEALENLEADQFDALFIPGGFGVAKNCSDLAFKGAELKLEQSFSAAITRFLENQKPIVALCIAPAVISKLTPPSAKLTIGSDKDTANVIEKLGATHVSATPTDVVIDQDHRLITCPCYMSASSIVEISQGVEKAVKALKSMLDRL